jgi:rhodanese-related sulfurtransferase/predicted transcriptional regulator
VRPREFKDRLYAELGRVGLAMASPRRLELLDLLAQGQRSVEELAREAALSVANASRHLQVLRGARLVDSRKQGLRVYYRLATAEVHHVARSLHALAQARLAEVDQLVNAYLGARDELEPVPRDELLRRVRDGRALVIDVRPAEEYRSGHIAGARSIPLAELDRRLRQLPARKEIVAYCRGPYCAMAHEAVARLRATGRRARRLAGGFPEWRAAGLPVGSGESSG